MGSMRSGIVTAVKATADLDGSSRCRRVGGRGRRGAVAMRDLEK
jgi:hypothetical protein